MQQILVIHGGDAFPTYDEYIRSLHDTVITLEPRAKDWKSNLQEDLGEGYQVFTPSFPNKQNARYEEWKIIFEKYLELLDNPILIGHSLGGIFLAKYASEETFTKPIKATFLIAAPFSTEHHEPIMSFTIDRKLRDAGVDGTGVYLYHSSDDAVVPYASFRLFKNEMPEAIMREFRDRGHFNEEHLPELVEDIKSLNTTI